MDITWLDICGLSAIGLLAGAAGGLLGIGGSVVMIPGLVMLLGARGQHLYQASAMIVNFFVVLPSVVRHQGAGAVLRPITRWTVPAAAAGALVGATASDLPLFRGAGRGYLQLLFAAFLFYTLAYNLGRLRSPRRLPPMDEAAAAAIPRWRILALVGLPAGLLGGLLGVGGGLIAVPTQQVFLRVPLPNAIANSAATILWSSVVGAAVKNAGLFVHGFTLRESAVLAAALLPTAMIGAWIAAPRVHRWPVRALRAAFSVLLLYSGIALARAGASALRSKDSIPLREGEIREKDLARVVRPALARPHHPPPVRAEHGQAVEHR